MREFRLVPFPAAEIPAVEITGKIARQGNLLSIHYSVQGDIGDIRLPARSGSPARKDDLWKATCFEFFLAVKDRPEYWEFNLSPSGDWNIYAMDGYRQVNMREESTYLQLPLEFTKMNNALSLDAEVSLSQLFQPLQLLQIGITAIIQTVEGKETYWALAHPSMQADFHLRKSFLVEL